MPNLPEPTDSVAVSGDGEPTLVRVFYATDRARTGSRDPDDFHGGDFAELEYGRVEVSIPPGHEVGELESPSILRFEFRADPDKHVAVMICSGVCRLLLICDLLPESATSARS